MSSDTTFLSTLNDRQLGSWHQFLDSLHALAAAPEQQIARFPPIA